MKSFKLDWCIAGVLAILASAIYFTGLVDYVFPGEAAQLMSAWAGLEPLPTSKFPLMAWFYRISGLGQALAPLCGVVSAVLLYYLTSFFILARVGRDYSSSDAVRISRLAGAVAALIFTLTPAVRSAATHLDPNLFDATWALLAFSCVVAYLRLPRSLAWLSPVAVGLMVGLGVAETATFVCLMPLYLLVFWSASRKCGGKGYGAAALFLLVFLAAGIVYTLLTFGSFNAWWGIQKGILTVWFKSEGSFIIPLFTTLPFVVALFSSGRAFGSDRGVVPVSFHGLMTLVAILALSTPLSASTLMAPTSYAPVVVSVFAAFTAGYLMAFWWSLTRSCVTTRTTGKDGVASLTAGQIGWIGGGVFALILSLTLIFDFFWSADVDRGSFADRVAERIVSDLGDRTWFVMNNDDGSLDSHLRLAAKKAGKELNLICLRLNNDPDHIEDLAKRLEAAGLGQHCENLRKFGILKLLQDWFATDPDIAQKVAIFGAPDLWSYAPQTRAVPELLFFGGDPDRAVSGFDDRRAFEKILFAPEGWGSFRSIDKAKKTQDSVEATRLYLRRHLGFVTCCMGCREHAEGRQLQKAGLTDEAQNRYDAAFDYYDFVLNELDPDNICARFNELELLDQGNKKAKQKQKEIISELDAIKKAVEKDERYRYNLSALPIVYGYLMNPELVLKLGMSFLSGGEYAQGIGHIRRAIDLVPSEQASRLQLLLAGLYAEGRTNKAEAQEIYLKELDRNPDSQVALLGLVRLAMLTGDEEKAIDYLERATKDAGNDVKSFLAIAALRLMRNEVGEARRVLQQATDREHGNLEAWSMTAMAVLRQLDAVRLISDKDAREVRRKELEDELEKVILPTMARQDPSGSNLTVLTTRAFVKMYKGGKANWEAARADLLQVLKLKPTSASIEDQILGLDILLHDTDGARLRASSILRVDPNAPRANYILGSLALGNDDLVTAERHLRKSVKTPRPDPMALNDLAELLRRKQDYGEAESVARQATQVGERFFVVWETLGTILLEGGKEENLPEAERCIQKACDMSKDSKGNPMDPRMLISLARVQIKLNKLAEAKKNLRIVSHMKDKLSPFDLKQFEKVIKLAQ